MFLVTRRAEVFTMESNTETEADRARVGRRTPVVLTMKKLFFRRIPSTSRRGSPMSVLDNALKIWVELITLINDNATRKFYGLWWFQKIVIFS